MSPEQRLDALIDRYTPEIAAHARLALATMRERLPGAVEMVYDNYNALAIGFGATERPSEFIFSIVLYPRWVTLFFLKGAHLDDPRRRLSGSGKQVRSIRLDDIAVFDDPDVRALMDAAVACSRPPFDPTAPRRLIIRSVAAKQRPRRPD